MSAYSALSILMITGSALFAITQYFHKNQEDGHEELKKKISGLPGRMDPASVTERDNILNSFPASARNYVIALFIYLFLCSYVHVLILFDDPFSQYIFIISAPFITKVLGVSIALMFIFTANKFKLMIAECKDYKDRVSNYIYQHEVFNRTPLP
jgi:hypothetical protein